MLTRRRDAAAAAIAGIAPWLVAPASAQDSTAPAAAALGDALDAYAVGPAGGQRVDYVVDLAPITSSWGGRYAIGPIMKSSRTTGPVGPAGGAFNHFIASHGASSTLGSALFPRPSYAAWSAPGQGVAPGINAPPMDDGSGQYGVLNVGSLRAWRMGAAMFEFGAGPDGNLGTGDNENNIIGASIAFQTRRVNRLYVSRTTALTNKSAAGAAGANTSAASLGFGGVDDLGTVHVLADGMGLLAPNRLLDRRLVRVRSAQRDTAIVNRLQAAGPADAAATQTLTGVAPDAILTTPAIIPQTVAARPVLLATDFASNLLYEAAAGAVSTTRAHLPAPTGSSRGTLSVVARPFARVSSGGSDAGTAALPGRTDGNTRTGAISIFGVNTDGSVDSQQQLVLPAGGLTDPIDGFDPGAAFPALAGHEFSGYGSQVPFRGGNGQVALAVLGDGPGGDLLAAALVAATGGAATVPTGPDNYIAVARVSAATGAVAWTIAAHTGDAMGAAGNTSKTIRQDADGDGMLDAAPLGRLAQRSELPGSPPGPSISAPAMDQSGNVYFFSAVRLDTGPVAEWTTALIRANYNPAAGPAGGYELELLARIGDVVAGANSATEYRIEYLGVTDSNSADSGSMWSGCLMPARLPLVPAAAAAAYGSPLSLGALVVRARILYDASGDGAFVDPTLPGGAGSTDQAYNAAMVLMPRIARGDANRDGVVNSTDISVFLTLWLADVTGGTTAVDWDAGGTTNSSDISAFLTDWLASVN